MKQLTGLICTSILLAGGFNSLAIAQPVEQPPAPSPEAVPTVELSPVPSPEATPTETAPTGSNTFVPRVGARYTTEGAGFDPYFTIEGFTPLQQTPSRFLTFSEGRLLIFTPNGTPLGANVTVGHRFLSPSGERIFGGYLAYDNRNTGSASFNQIGAGLESLSDKLDFRVNGYLPVGNTRSLLGTTSTGFVSQGGLLQFDRVQTFQEAVPGFDAEVGTRIANLGDTGSLRGYAGLYYYGGNVETVGFRGRLLARPTELISLGLTLQNDSRFDTRLVFNVGVNFPSSGAKGSAPNSLIDRLGDSPERVATITVDDQTTRQVLTPTLSGMAQRVRFVDLGNGSLGTIQEALNVAQANETIFVGPDAAGNSGFNLATAQFDDVKLLGVSSPQTLQFDQGSIALQPTSSNRPAINGNVTLGNRNTLSGFAIGGAVTLMGNDITLTNATINPAGSGRGISGTGINNVTIQSSTVTNALGEAIYLENVTGAVAIRNNEITNTVADAFTEANDGIAINNNTGVSNLTIAGNTVTNTGQNGINVLLAGDAQSTAQIDGNTISGTNTGIIIPLSGNAQETLAISNNTINNVAGNGILVLPDGTSRLNLSVTGNNLTTNAEGILIGVNSTNPLFGGNDFLPGSAATTATIANNNVTTSNGAAGLLATTEKASTACLQINNNTSAATFNLDNLSSFDTATLQVVDQATLSSRNNGIQFPTSSGFSAVSSVAACSAP